MKPSEIIVGHKYSSNPQIDTPSLFRFPGTGPVQNVREVLTFVLAGDRPVRSMVRYKVITSKISGNIGSVKECKLTTFANWAWARID